MSHRILFLCKRFYSSQDLIHNRFGRYAHLPTQLQEGGMVVRVAAIDQKNLKYEQCVREGVLYSSFPILDFHRGITKAIRSFKPDLIVAGGHLYVGEIALQAAKASAIPWIYDLYDYYPAFCQRFDQLAKRWHQRLVIRASGISCASQALLEDIAGLGAKAAIVRNACEKSLFSRRNREASRRKLNLPRDSVLVGYTGAFGERVMVDECLDAVTWLRKTGVDAIFVQLGHNVKNLKHPYFLSLGNHPLEAVPEFINACDLLVAPYRNTEMVRYTNACKLSEYAACEAVVVASSNGDYKNYIPVDYPGLFDPNQPEALKRAFHRQIHEQACLERNDSCFWEYQADSLRRFVTLVLG